MVDDLNKYIYWSNPVCVRQTAFVCEMPWETTVWGYSDLNYSRPQTPLLPSSLVSLLLRCFLSSRMTMKWQGSHYSQHLIIKKHYNMAWDKHADLNQSQQFKFPGYVSFSENKRVVFLLTWQTLVHLQLGNDMSGYLQETRNIQICNFAFYNASSNCLNTVNSCISSL